MKSSVLLIASLACLIGACSSGKAPPPAATAADPAPQAMRPTVFDAQLKALDKAKAVQGVVDKQKADADKKLDDQGG
jgi:hypothetical protein